MCAGLIEDALKAALSEGGFCWNGIGRTPAARRSAKRGFELQHIGGKKKEGGRNGISRKGGPYGRKDIETDPNLCTEIRVTARSEDGEVMAIKHRQYPIYGIQFHPESVMTPEGHRMIENFVRSVTRKKDVK